MSDQTDSPLSSNAEICGSEKIVAIFHLDFSKVFDIICHCIPVSQFRCYEQVKKRVDDQVCRGVRDMAYSN